MGFSRIWTVFAGFYVFFLGLMGLLNKFLHMKSDLIFFGVPLLCDVITTVYLFSQVMK